MKQFIIVFSIILFVVLCFLVIERVRFDKKVASELQDVISKQTNSNDEVNINEVIAEEELNDLPEVVQKWLSYAGIVGIRRIETVFLKQEGELRISPDQEKWNTAKATQSFNVIDPSFIWSVQTKMMGIPVVGRDLFIEGKGDMLIKLLAVIPVVDIGNHNKINESTLQRYLGEIIWFPTAALSPYITWEEINETSAKAKMTYGENSGEVTFHFSEDGSLSKIEALRYRDISDEKPTLWVAKVLQYKTLNKLKIPVDIEVTWMLEEGPFTWYRFKIIEVQYDI